MKMVPRGVHHDVDAERKVARKDNKKPSRADNLKAKYARRKVHNACKR